MSDITTYKGGELPENISSFIKEKYPNLSDLNAGDIFLTNSSWSPVIKITKIESEITKDESEIIVFYKRSLDYTLTDYETEEHRSRIQSFMSDYSKYPRIKAGEKVDDYIGKAADFISGKADPEEHYNTISDDGLNNESALISKSSKQSLIILQQDLEERTRRVNLVRAVVSLEMEKKKNELEQVRKRLDGVLQVFHKKIGKIMRVITTIELYLGINEEIFQINAGELAPAATPLSFRQAVLYIDEEVGHWEDGGLDWTDIKWFDEWLIKDDNYKRLLPEEKGLLVFRPRRYDKDYGKSDPYYSAKMNNANKYRTYIMVRNGECLYRIYTENIVILPRLFPQRFELQKMMDEINKESFDSRRYDNKEEQVDNIMYQYRKRAVLLQGLIDRTEIFHPLPVEKINIFDMSNLEGNVNFIYDDEAALPSGRKTFKEWKADINTKISKGSRVLIISNFIDKDDIKRNTYYFFNEYNAPPSPCTGVYEVEEYAQDKYITVDEYDWIKERERLESAGVGYEVLDIVNQKRYNQRTGTDEYVNVYKICYIQLDLTIMYNPGDVVYGGWGSFDSHERKNRIRFQIHRSEDYVLNYDQIDLADIDFYLTSRVDRPNYLEMMPVLENIKAWLIAEKETEKSFVEMVYGQLISKTKASQEDLYRQIWASVDWWKFKNMWKRPIAKDDSKALRMICSNVLKNNP